MRSPLRRPFNALVPLLAQLGRGLDQLVFPLPAHCLLCGGEESLLAAGVCTSCLGTLRRPLKEACHRCGRPLGVPLGGPMGGHAVELCPECQTWLAQGRPLLWEKVRAVALYEGEIKRLIWRFKYQGDLWLARPLGELMALVARVSLPPADALVPVPMETGRQRRRGFNQAEELARVVSTRWGIPVVRALGRRRGGTGAGIRQASLGQADRWVHLREAFSPLVNVAGKSIILIDDVLTTGATLAYCTEALLGAGAERVSGLVLATVPVRRA